jgi:hypothetical protein
MNGKWMLWWMVQALLAQRPEAGDWRLVWSTQKEHLEEQVNKLQQDATGRNNFAEILQLWVSDLQCSKTKQHPIMTRPWNVIWGWQPSELAKQLCTSSFLQSLDAEYTGWQLFLLSIQSFTSWILSTTQHILWHVPDHFKLEPYIPAYPVF